MLSRMGALPSAPNRGYIYYFSLTPLIPLALAKRDRVLKPTRTRVVYMYLYIYSTYYTNNISVVVTLRSLRSVLRRERDN